MSQKKRRRKVISENKRKNSSGVFNAEPVAKLPVIKIEEPRKPKKNSLLSALTSLKSIGGLILTLITIYGAYEYFKPKHQKFKEDTTISGILIPPQIQKQYDHIVIKKGFSISKIHFSQLKDGYPFLPRDIIVDDPFDEPLIFQMKNDRVYVKARIRDLEMLDVGEVNLDKWELVKGNLRDFDDTDSTLEVIDRFNLVVFSLAYQYPNIIVIRGYEMLQNSCLVNDPVKNLFTTVKKEKDSIIKSASQITRLSTPKEHSNFPIWIIIIVVTVIYFLLRYLQAKKRKKAFREPNAVK